MSLEPRFALAWREWQRNIPSFVDARNNQTRAPTYTVEGDLDHLASYVSWLGNAMVNGKELDFTQLASTQLAKLDFIADTLEALSGPPPRALELRRFIERTRVLLEAIVKQDLVT